MYLSALVVTMTTALSLSSCGNTQEPEKDPVTITISGITDTYAKATVKSEDESMLYVAAVMPTEFIEDEETLVKITLEDIMATISQTPGLTFEYWLEDNGFKGSFEQEMPGLLSETEYRFFVFGVDKDGKDLTKAYFKDFTTNVLGQQNVEFTLEEYEISYTQASVTVTPSNEKALYYFEIVENSVIEEKGSLEAYMDFVVDYYTQQSSGADIIAQVGHRGKYDENRYDLKAGTEYTAFAVGVSEGFEYNSKFSTTTFTTTAVEPSNMTIEMELTEVGAAKGSFKIIPSTNDEYYVWYVVRKESMIQFPTDEKLIEYTLYNLGNEGYWDSNVLTGTQDVETYLNPDMDYVLISFGFFPEANAATTDVFKKDFKTKSLTADPCDVTFEFEVDENFNEFTIRPSDEVYYFWGVMSKAEYDMYEAEGKTLETVVGWFKEVCQNYSAFWNISLSEAAKDNCDVTTRLFSTMDLAVMPGEIVFYAFTVDLENVKNACEVGGFTVSDPVTVPDGFGDFPGGLLSKHNLRRMNNVRK